MGQSAAQTVVEIEQIRDRLDGEIHQLQERLPPGFVAGKRLIGIAVGGGLAGTVFWMLVRRRRAKHRRRVLGKGQSFTAEIRILPS